MLHKENRINKDKDFDRAFKTGQSFYSKILGVKAVQNNLDYTRFGFLISTKISKKAVARNHLRRQLRVISGRELAQLKPGYDIVFVALRGSVDQNFQDIFDNVKHIFGKLKLYYTKEDLKLS